jgi:hypothetical protein
MHENLLSPEGQMGPQLGNYFSMVFILEKSSPEPAGAKDLIFSSRTTRLEKLRFT